MEFRILFSLWIWAFLVLKITRVLNSPTPSVHQQSDGPSLAQFNETFYLDEWEDYKHFIQRLRGKKELISKYLYENKKELISTSLYEKIPVLHPEETIKPTKFFDVILKVDGSDPNSKEVTLRIRQDNLYLVGYQNASNHWLEFRPSGENKLNLITGSTLLEFNGSYASLESNAKNREKIRLGQNQLHQAVSDLATSTDTERRAKGLIIVIQMISESMRFKSITEFLSITDASEITPPTRVLEQQKSWAKISRELLLSDAYRNHTFKPPGSKTEITSKEDAVKAIGMIKYIDVYKSVGGSKNEGEYPQAYPMVEVP